MAGHFFAALACAYIAMLALCQGLERHYKQVWHAVATAASVITRWRLAESGAEFLLQWSGVGMGDGPGGLVRADLVKRFRVAHAAALPASAGRVVTGEFCPDVGCRGDAVVARLGITARKTG